MPIRMLAGSNQSGFSREERQVIRAAASRQRLNPRLLQSLIMAESGGVHKVGGTVSSAGAMGYGQLMPATAKGLGVNPWDPVQNIEGAAKYLRQQLNTFGGNLKMALAAYNAGPGAVSKYGGVPPYAETQAYVEKILAMMGGEGAGGAPGTTAKAQGGGGGPGAGSYLSKVTPEQMRHRIIGPISERVVEGQISRRSQLADMLNAGNPGAQSTTNQQGAPPQGGFTAGGGWGGSRGVAAQAYAIAKQFGAPITSEKRQTKYTASGGISDHWEGSKNSWATDIAATGKTGYQIAAQIAKQYGIPNYKPGQWASHVITVGKAKYRLQLGWMTPGHDDHVHFGIKRI